VRTGSRGAEPTAATGVVAMSGEPVMELRWRVAIAESVADVVGAETVLRGRSAATRLVTRTKGAREEVSGC
jgi:hypothetical protein